MDYKLVTQLKDAGFPLRYAQSPFEIANVRFDDGSIAYEPTLSELIKACGENFGCISKANSKEAKERWGNNDWHASQENFIDYNHAYGSTPEEAVAKLWLELNK